MSVLSLSSSTVRGSAREATLLQRARASVTSFRLAARRRDQERMVLRGDLGPSQRDEALAVLGRR